MQHGCVDSGLADGIYRRLKDCCTCDGCLDDRGLTDVVLGDLESQRGQIKDLACFAHISKRQATPTGLALRWYAMNNDLVGLCGLTQGADGLTFLSTCWFLARNT